MKKRYAFIDVQNTNGTVNQLLNFSIDWQKLISHLKNEKWNCADVFYYKGRRKGEQHDKQIQKLEDMGYIVRSKLTHIHPDKPYIQKGICKKCGASVELASCIQGDRKSNCDVELTVDALRVAYSDNSEKEFLIFTGDGDFRFLMEALIAKEVKIIIISNTKRNNNGDKRFSTRLKDLIKQEKDKGNNIEFIDINDWKQSIKKESPSSVAILE